MPEAPATARLLIDLSALQENYHRLQAKAAPALCAAAIKADAYGTGMSKAAPALWAAGCRNFFVARPPEGARLRQMLPQAKIFVLDGLVPHHAAYYAQHQLIPCLASPAEIEEWLSFTATQAQAYPAALHLDTGINRLGLTSAEFAELVSDEPKLKQLNPALLMSHLACADEPAHPLNQRQLERFSQMRQRLPEIPASLANSSGIYLGTDYSFDLTRPGIALYGGNPTPNQPNPMRPVVTLEAMVLQIRHVPQGETQGYSATWTAARDSRVAIINLGYADGLLRSLSHHPQKPAAEIFITGKRCPIIGRVSMDMTAIDITNLPPDLLKRGDWVEIFGRNIPIDDVANRAATISYELLTRLGNRYARHYVEADSEP